MATNWFDDDYEDETLSPQAALPAATVPTARRPRSALEAFNQSMYGESFEADEALPDEVPLYSGTPGVQRGLQQYAGPQEGDFGAPGKVVPWDEVYRRLEEYEANKPKPALPIFRPGDFVDAAGSFIGGIPTTATEAFYRMKEGSKRPDEFSPEAHAAFAASRTYQERMEYEREQKEQEGTATVVGQAIREAGPSSGYTIGSMGPALLGGLAGAKVGTLAAGPVGTVVGGIAGGFAGSGAASYTMAQNQFMEDAFHRAEQRMQKTQQRSLNEQEKQALYEAMEPLAHDSALWEAGPEAVGNAFMLVGGGIAAGLIGKQGIQKLAGGAFRKGMIRTGALATGVGMEFATETATQLGQGLTVAQQEAYLEGKPMEDAVSRFEGKPFGGVGEAFEEIWRPTLGTVLMFGLAGGAVKGASKIDERLRQNPQEAEAIADMADQPEVLAAMPDQSLANLQVLAGHLRGQWFAGTPRQEAMDQALANISAEQMQRAGEDTETQNLRKQVLGETWGKMAPQEQSRILDFLGATSPGLTGWTTKEGAPTGQIDARALHKFADSLGFEGKRFNLFKEMLEQIRENTRVRQQNFDEAEGQGTVAGPSPIVDDYGDLPDAGSLGSQPPAPPAPGLSQVPPAAPIVPPAPAAGLPSAPTPPTVPAAGPTAIQEDIEPDTVEVVAGQPTVTVTPGTKTGLVQLRQQAAEAEQRNIQDREALGQQILAEALARQRAAQEPPAPPAAPITPTPGETVQLQQGQEVILTPPAPGAPVSRVTPTPEEQTRLQDFMGERPTRTPPAPPTPTEVIPDTAAEMQGLGGKMADGVNKSFRDAMLKSAQNTGQLPDTESNSTLGKLFAKVTDPNGEFGLPAQEESTLDRVLAVASEIGSQSLDDPKVDAIVRERFKPAAIAGEVAQGEVAPAPIAAPEAELTAPVKELRGNAQNRKAAAQAAKATQLIREIAGKEKVKQTSQRKRAMESAYSSLLSNAARLGIEVPKVGTFYNPERYVAAAEAVEAQIPQWDDRGNLVGKEVAPARPKLQDGWSNNILKARQAANAVGLTHVEVGDAWTDRDALVRMVNERLPEDMRAEVAAAAPDAQSEVRSEPATKKPATPAGIERWAKLHLPKLTDARIAEMLSTLPESDQRIPKLQEEQTKRESDAQENKRFFTEYRAETSKIIDGLKKAGANPSVINFIATDTHPNIPKTKPIERLSATLKKHQDLADKEIERIRIEKEKPDLTQENLAAFDAYDTEVETLAKSMKESGIPQPEIDSIIENTIKRDKPKIGNVRIGADFLQEALQTSIKQLRADTENKIDEAKRAKADSEKQEKLEQASYKAGTISFAEGTPRSAAPKTTDWTGESIPDQHWLRGWDDAQNSARPKQPAPETRHDPDIDQVDSQAALEGQIPGSVPADETAQRPGERSPSGGGIDIARDGITRNDWDDDVGGVAGEPGTVGVQGPDVGLATPRDDRDAAVDALWGNLVNEALDEAFAAPPAASATPKPKPKPARKPRQSAPKPAAEPQTGQQVKEKARHAASELAQAADKATDGLLNLFFSPGQFGSGLPFSPEQYERAKPMFFAAAQHLRAATADIAEILRLIVADVVRKGKAAGMDKDALRQGLENIAPYATRFAKDVEDGVITLDVETSSVEETPAQAKGAALTGENPGNYAITDADRLGEGGDTTKVEQNIAAIRLVKQLEAENRYATREEQAILAKYVGWGGLKGAFAPSSDQQRKWNAKLNALKNEGILTDKEYNSAWESTADAHYTSKPVVDAMYRFLGHMGFTGGRVLEPTVGSGNFIGLMPDAMAGQSHWFASEIDSVTSLIAKHLYPDAQVKTATAFEEAEFPYGRFDLAIGNPPFGALRITDNKEQRKALDGWKIHNYVIGKSALHLRPGGVMAMVVTSRFMDTMDASSKETRDWLNQNMWFLGAVRLPNTAFKKNAGTDVVTDIVFFMRPDPSLADQVQPVRNWTEMGSVTTDGKSVPVNQYFADNPHLMFGQPSMEGSMYGNKEEFTLKDTGVDIPAAFDQALQADFARLKGVLRDEQDARQDAPTFFMENREDIAVGGFILEDGKIYERDDNDVYGNTQFVEIGPDTQWTAKQTLGQARYDRIRGILELRGKSYALIVAEQQNAPNMENLRTALRKDYQAFINSFGPISAPANARLFEADPKIEFGLEKNFRKAITASRAKKLGIAPRGDSAEMADILTQRVYYPTKAVTHAKDAIDGFSISLSERGKLDLQYIAELTTSSMTDVIDALSAGPNPRIFNDPSTNEWVAADEYLSGNVKKKLKQAQDAGLEANANSLEKVLPADVAMDDIHVELGAPWVPAAVYNDFLKLLGIQNPEAIVASSGQIILAGADRLGVISNQFNADLQNNDLTVAEMFLNLANKKALVAYDIVTDEKGNDRKQVNVERTKVLQPLGKSIIKMFNDWVRADPDRAILLEKEYNDKINTSVDREFDGKFLRVKDDAVVGANPSIKLRPNQKRAAWRMIVSKNVLMDHVVGAGKTITLAAGVMERKRTGLSNKPMIAVPNHLVPQWTKDFLALYPGARLLAANEKDFAPANRKKFMARMTTGNYDAIIIGHSMLVKMPVNPETRTAFVDQEVRFLERLRAEMEEAGENKRKISGINKRIDSLRQKLRASIDKDEQDNVVFFEDTGVDYLVVDESHEFKNLMYHTNMTPVVGMGDPKGSNKAFDLYMKTGSIRRRDGGITFATGTPISNSLVEMYAILRYLNPQGLEERNLESFDAWLKTFAGIDEVTEYTATGQLKARNILTSFSGVPELLQLYRAFADTVTMDDLKRMYTEAVTARNKELGETERTDFPVPKVAGGGRQLITVPISPAQRMYVEYLTLRVKVMEGMTGKERKEYAAIDNPLWVYGDAKKAALDIRIVDPTAIEEGDSKVNRAVGNIKRIYDKTQGVRGTQLVFSDLSTPKKVADKDAKKFIQDALNVLDLSMNQGLSEEVAAAETYRGKWNLLSAAIQGNIEWAGITEMDAYREKLEDFMTAVSDDQLSAITTADSGFSVYDDVREKLVAQGIPENEIAFIHDYNSKAEKQELFDRVNAGEVRVLLGSTPKMGAGTNVQERAVALHHLDAPWRPSDMEQREGRIIRQKNQLYLQDPDGFEVEIYAYSTENTFDAVMWQVLSRKAGALEQFRQGKRVVEEVNKDSASYAEFMAETTGNPIFREKFEVQRQVDELDSQYRRTQMQTASAQEFLSRLKGRIALENSRIEEAQAVLDKLPESGELAITVEGEPTVNLDLAKIIKEEAYKYSAEMTQFGDDELANNRKVNDFIESLESLPEEAQINLTKHWLRLGGTNVQLNPENRQHYFNDLLKAIRKQRGVKELYKEVINKGLVPEIQEAGKPPKFAIALQSDIPTKPVYPEISSARVRKRVPLLRTIRDKMYALRYDTLKIDINGAQMEILKSSADKDKNEFEVSVDGIDLFDTATEDGVLRNLILHVLQRRMQSRQEISQNELVRLEDSRVKSDVLLKKSNLDDMKSNLDNLKARYEAIVEQVNQEEARLAQERRGKVNPYVERDTARDLHEDVDVDTTEGVAPSSTPQETQAAVTALDALDTATPSEAALATPAAQPLTDYAQTVRQTAPDQTTFTSRLVASLGEKVRKWAKSLWNFTGKVMALLLASHIAINPGMDIQQRAEANSTVTQEAVTLSAPQQGAMAVALSPNPAKIPIQLADASAIPAEVVANTLAPAAPVKGKTAYDSFLNDIADRQNAGQKVSRSREDTDPQWAAQAKAVIAKAQRGEALTPIEHAWTMWGQQEGQNEQIQKILDHFGSKLSQDAYPWCASFVSYTFARAGVKGVHTQSSRAFLTKGQAVQKAEARLGDLVVLWNDNPQTGGRRGYGGHVGYLVKQEGDVLWVLGGNQNDMVNVIMVHTDRLLGIRRIQTQQPTQASAQLAQTQPDTDQRRYSRAESESITSQGLDLALDAVMLLGANSALFSNPKAHAKDLSSIVKEIDSKLKVNRLLTPLEIEALNEETGSRNAVKGTSIAVPTKAGSREAYSEVYVIENDRGEVWIDVSNLQQGTGGNMIYSIASDYAINNNKEFIGDPAGMKPASLVRRTENMVSSAVKHGTTRHLRPHPLQNIPWGTSDLENFKTLIRVSIENTLKAFPELKDIRYDFDRFGFFGRDGKPVSEADFERLARRREGDGRTSFAGSSTLRRAAFLNTLSSGKSPVVREKILAAVERELLEPLRLEDAQLNRLFYSQPPEKSGVSTTEPTATLTIPAARAETVEALGETNVRNLEKNGFIVWLEPKPGAQPLPGNNRTYLSSTGQEVVAPHDAQAFVDKGVVHLIPSNMRTGAMNSQLHESAHLMLDERYTEGNRTILRMSHAALNLVGLRNFIGNPGFQDLVNQVQRMAQEGNAVAIKALAQARRVDPNRIAEESITYLVEYGDPKLPLVRRILAAIRAALYRMGVKVELRPEDVRQLAISALKARAQRNKAEQQKVMRLAQLERMHEAKYGDLSLGELRVEILRNIKEDTTLAQFRELVTKMLERRYSYAGPNAPTSDANYLAAVERGDMETAQRMVAEAAERAGYKTVAFKGMMSNDWRTGNRINILKSPNGDWAGFFSSSKKVADGFRDVFATMGNAETLSAYLDMTGAREVDAQGKRARDFQIDNLDTTQRRQDLLSLINNSDSGIIIRNTEDEANVFIAKRPDQVKRSDSVTYDDAGNVIPLSQRFDRTSPDVRYSRPPRVKPILEARSYINLVEDNIVKMSPEVYLKLAIPFGYQKGPIEDVKKVKKLAKMSKWDTLPMLSVKKNDEGQFQIGLHDGRHRARAAIARGDAFINVEIVRAKGRFERENPDISDADLAQILTNTPVLSELGDYITVVKESDVRYSRQPVNISLAAPIQESDNSRAYRESLGYTRIIRVNAAAFQAEFEQQNNENLVHKPARMERLKEFSPWDAYPLVGIMPHINRLSVDDGRHRIAVASERGQEIDIAVTEEQATAIQNLFKNASNFDSEYLAAVERSDMETAQRMVDEAAEQSGLRTFESPDVTAFSVRRATPPKQTVRRYKAFRLVNGQLRALYVGAKDDIPMGAWLDAKEGGFKFRGPDKVNRKTGERSPGAWYVTGGTGTPTKMSDLPAESQAILRENGINTAWVPLLAFRPGWHSGTLPFNPQGAGPKDRQYKKGELSEEHPYQHILDPDVVIAEVELSADINYQKEFEDTATRNKDGSIKLNESGVRKIPVNGFYNYTTNANNRDLPGDWSIGGALKVNRLLTQDEANSILISNGAYPQLRVGGPLNLDALGYDPRQTDASSTKLLDPVTRDDAGNVIPLSQRFDATTSDVRYSRQPTGQPPTPADAQRFLNDVGGMDMEPQPNILRRLWNEPSAWRQALKSSVADTVGNTRPAWTRLLSRQQIVEMLQESPIARLAKHFEDTARLLDADKADGKHLAFDIAKRLREAAAKSRDKGRGLYKLWFFTTLESVDPTQPAPQRDNYGDTADYLRARQSHTRAVEMLNELRKANPVLADLYKEVIVENKRSFEAYHQALKDRLGRGANGIFTAMMDRAKDMDPTATPTTLTQRLAKLAEDPAAYDAFTETVRERLQQPGMKKDDAAAIRDTLPDDTQKALFDDLVADVRGKIKSSVDALQSVYEQARVLEPYFPLSRWGQYQVYAEKAGEPKPVFSAFAREQDQRAAIAQLQKEGWTVKVNYDAAGKLTFKPPADSFLGKMFVMVDEMVSNSKERLALKDEFYQMYLRSLPDLSSRKHFLHRAGIPGFSMDALRGFAQLANSRANAIARLKHSDILSESLMDMERTLKRTGLDPSRVSEINRAGALLGELQSSYEWMMNPTNATWANRLTSFGFLWHLTNPSTALVNLTQVPIATFPDLAAKFGGGSAFSAIGKAIKDYGAWKFRGKVAKEQAMQRLYAEFDGDLGLALKSPKISSQISRTEAVALAGMSDDAPEFSGGAKGSAAALYRGALFYGGWLYQKAEVANREITVIAAYRLARRKAEAEGKSREQAHDYATETAYNSMTRTQGDFSLANRAWFMRGNAMRVMFLFRSFSHMMTFNMLRDAYQAVKGKGDTEFTNRKGIRDSEGNLKKITESKLARDRLVWTGISSLVFAGATGFPMYTIVAALANAVWGSDPDDPWDFDMAVREELQAYGGETLMRTVMQGPLGQAPRALNLLGLDVKGMDIAPRVSLDLIRLWVRRQPEDSEGGAGMDWWMGQIAGPLYGTARGMAEGLRMLGQTSHDPQAWHRTLEGLTPAPIRNLAKAARFEQHGVTTRRGDLLMDDVGFTDLITQAIGFTPDELADQYRTNTRAWELKALIDKRRRNIYSLYIFSVEQGDEAMQKTAMERVERWNELNPEYPITFDGLRSAYRNFARARAQSEAGVYIPSQGLRARVFRDLTSDDE